jgi:hypothetical protein
LSLPAEYKVVDGLISWHDGALLSPASSATKLAAFYCSKAVNFEEGRWERGLLRGGACDSGRDWTTCAGFIASEQLVKGEALSICGEGSFSLLGPLWVLRILTLSGL